jgi:hypothetical protein
LTAIRIHEPMSLLPEMVPSVPRGTGWGSFITSKRTRAPVVGAVGFMTQVFRKMCFPAGKVG